MSENRDNEPHALEIVMAAGPAHLTIWPSLKDADDKSKGVEGRREDFIRLRPDMFGLRIRFPRAFMTGARVYPATPAQLAEARERAATEPKAPSEAVIGKPLETPAEGGNGKPKEAPAAEPPAEPAPRPIKTSPA